MDLAAQLRESISRMCDVPESEIHDESTLVDLGFDSLASAEVLTDLEMKVGFDFPVDALRALNRARTVADVVSILRAASPAGSTATP
jgi:acyl carrier protein